MTDPALQLPQWDHIDAVLLDLDGTLLDLAFDNHFWRRAVPEAFARARDLSFDQALEQLRPRFAARVGTLDWYCIDHWSRELELDLAALQRTEAHRIRWLPGAREFLDGVRALGKRLVLVTNAHPVVLALKDSQVQVLRHFDRGLSSHSLGAPKEVRDFWERLAQLEALVLQRCLFVDDSPPVLQAARAAGVAQLYAVRRPASDAPARPGGEFHAVDSLAQLL